MRHVFGVAFARVEMDSSAQQELELSFLRISYAILRAREDGDEAQGYLAVVRQEARDALRRLKSVYGVGDELTIVFASLLVSDLAMLADAAERVRTGEDEDAERKVAGHIATGALRREISEKEPGHPGDASGRAVGFLWRRPCDAAADGCSDYVSASPVNPVESVMWHWVWTGYLHNRVGGT